MGLLIIVRKDWVNNNNVKLVKYIGLEGISKDKVKNIKKRERVEK